MENAQQSPRLADLVTILYRPRETMRRILDGRHRWSIAVVVLAFACASFTDIDTRELGDVLPGMKLLPTLALVTFSIIIGALLWVIALFIITWIATPIGRLLGGEGSMADVRAALGWGMVPIVWSVIYRIPVAIYVSRLQVMPKPNVRHVLLDFLSRGGCSVVVAFLVLQAAFALWCIVIGSFTLGEAQRFSTQKGFVNLAIALALPLLVFFAAVFTFRR